MDSQWLRKLGGLPTCFELFVLFPSDMPYKTQKYTSTDDDELSQVKNACSTESCPVTTKFFLAPADFDVAKPFKSRFLCSSATNFDSRNYEAKS